MKAHAFVILDSSMVEHSAVNRRVVGSSPTRGVNETCKNFLAGLFVSCRRDEKGFTVRCVILGVTETKEN